MAVNKSFPFVQRIKYNNHLTIFLNKKAPLCSPQHLGGAERDFLCPLLLKTKGIGLLTPLTSITSGDPRNTGPWYRKAWGLAINKWNVNSWALREWLNGKNNNLKTKFDSYVKTRLSRQCGHVNRKCWIKSQPWLTALPHSPSSAFPRDTSSAKLASDAALWLNPDKLLQPPSHPHACWWLLLCRSKPRLGIAHTPPWVMLSGGRFLHKE